MKGVDTYHIKRKFTLHLSGTPFKALANDKFPEEAIYNWTYADEQKAKHGLDCFDQSDKTFIDLYMKSGLYITEIVKRLYRSEAMKAQYPAKAERLRHIFEKQVYGLAPTEIIYRIAISYILGFDEEIHIEKHNFSFLKILLHEI